MLTAVAARIMTLHQIVGREARRVQQPPARARIGSVDDDPIGTFLAFLAFLAVSCRVVSHRLQSLYC
jgi:hypothetical protein